MPLLTQATRQFVASFAYLKGREGLWLAYCGAVNWIIHIYVHMDHVRVPGLCWSTVSVFSRPGAGFHSVGVRDSVVQVFREPVGLVLGSSGTMFGKASIETGFCRMCAMCLGPRDGVWFVSLCGRLPYHRGSRW